MFRRIVLASLLSAASLSGADYRAVSSSTGPSLAAKGQPALEEGELDGAKYAIARPAKWNHHLLLLAHGYRAEGTPLVADLFIEHGAYKTLLDEGWIIAKTSYRRNGIIVDDAIADLAALRAFIAQKYGLPDRVLLEGESMGGLIVTLIAERTPDATPEGKPFYAGAVAIGAALNVKEVTPAAALTYQPRLPLIFLTNQSELQGPQEYVGTPAATDGRSMPAVLFRVSRDGHVNVNQRERLVALRALNSWIERGAKTLPSPAPDQPFFDATQAVPPQPSLVKMQADGRGFDARVNEVSAIYGNVQLNVQVDDFTATGIKPMTWFQLKVGEKAYRVRYARDFNDVKRGEWVLFPNADGFAWLSRNYANAATTAHLNLGDIVSIRRFDESRSP